MIRSIEGSEWTWRGSGPWWKRLRIYFFGLTAAEQATNARIFAEMQARIREEHEQEDREFDEWWERDGKWGHWPWNVADTPACACGLVESSL